MKKGTRRGVLLLASMLVMLVVVGGVAWAVTKIGDDGPNKIKGSNGSDKIHGLRGNDELDGQGGSDRIWGDNGNDRLIDGGLRTDQATDKLYGGKGNDTLITRNKPQRKDFVSCGPGFDTWVADPVDRYYKSGGRCEKVHVRR